MSVWDVGANCGVFSFSCRQAGKIVAVEADPFLANLLVRSSMSNDLPVTIVSAAIADRHGLAVFEIAGRGRASNHLAAVRGSTQSGTSQTSLAVPTLTLDALMEEMGKPDVIKIDIEGSEPLALEGATNVLNIARPIIYIEIDSNIEARTRAPLDAAGYRLERVEGNNWLAYPPSQ